MTTREFFTAVSNNNITDKEVEFAKDAILKLDEKNKKRAEKPSKKSLENEPIKQAIASFLVGKDFTIASEIAKGCEITPNKASALCGQLVKAETLTVTDVKVKGHGTLKAYKLAK